MTKLKIVALVAFVALPVACSRDRREADTPEGMRPASGFEDPTPGYPIAPGPMQDPVAPGSGSQSPLPIEAEAPDTIGTSEMDTDATAAGGKGSGGKSGSSTGGSTGGTGKGTGGSSTGGRGGRAGMQQR